VILSKLLDDHRNALKLRKGEAVDLRQRMEKLSVAGQVATEEIRQLKVDLGCEVVACSS